MGKDSRSSLTRRSEWVDHYGDYLYTYAYYRVNSPELARDLVQETFLSALSASSKILTKIKYFLV